MTGVAGSRKLQRCEPLEIAAGGLYGLLPATALPPTSLTPRQALDNAILPALEIGPCFVTFSGGRDSSGILAAATALARREGLPLPIPVTRVYPDLPDTDESSWQRLVVDHLRLKDWVRLEFRGGESDLLGDAARGSLRRHGVLYPAALHSHGAMFERLEPGSLLTGEGGDAVLGNRRGTALALVRRRRINTEVARAAADALLPRPLQRLRTQALLKNSHQARWLQPRALAEHARRAAADIAAEPLLYPASTWFITRMRSFATIQHNHSAIAAEYGLRASDPLLDRGFLAALAPAGGRLGYPSRTMAMRALFSDVLPREALIRSTKASFNMAHTGGVTKEFARTWDGSGVDPTLVDVERLRQVWLSDQPTMTSGLLLQSAWLASRTAGIS